MNIFSKRAVALSLSLGLVACGGSSDSNTAAPTGFTVLPADGAVVVSWDEDSSLTYWLFSAQSTTLTRDNILQQPSPRILNGVTSPWAQTSLTNGLPYSFLMNAAVGSDKAGASTNVLTATPQASGYTWTAGVALDNVTRRGLVSSASIYVTVGSGGSIRTSGPAGTTWTDRTSGTTNDLRGVTWTSGLANLFVAVGANGTIVTSPDGITWTTRTSGTSANLNSVAVSAGYYVAVGDNGTTLYSADAVTWTAETPFTSATLLGINYNISDTKFYATGAGGIMFTSSDATTWTQVTTNTGNDLYSVAANSSGVRVAVGANGTIIESTDGTTWAVQASPTTQNLYAAVWGTQFEAVGAGGVALNGTTTGTVWTTANSGTTSDLYTLSFAFYRLMSLGAAGSNTLSY
ncbi:sialidase family protein [Amantichitinum ursilacus]|uniref:Ycf48-like protein n=1 Tax=Amantichitinum ursilacus TaxID=857265 RepID=A0A0N0XMP0_9NEIS|nr:hypothetical protein [Amantichitinum ursilacus]KPC54316.1 hypothetical protein WG78_06690 [Amantichitinum ursilacus]